jgi:signal transduction histidine kinase
MPSRQSGVAGRVISWHWDTIVAVASATAVLGYEAVAGGSLSSDWASLVVVMVSAVAVAARRRWPVVAAVALATALVLARSVGELDAINRPGPTLLAWVPVDLAYGLGLDAGAWSGLAGVILLAIGSQATDRAFNPLFEMVTFGPWLAGRAVRSRRRLSADIARRNQELDAERTRFARESVRYERARIARDLHDIVAHCVSVIVVQAGAAQRACAGDHTEPTAEALDCIAEAAAEARLELGALVDLLSASDGTGTAVPRPRIDDLVRRANAAGQSVRYEESAAAARLAGSTLELAYRVVQEGLTNALKHAAGATTEVVVRDVGAQLEVEVITEPPSGRLSGLEASGAGRGLAGLGERAAAKGGSLTAGPTGDGGWRVRALLPAVDGEWQDLERAADPAGARR